MTPASLQTQSPGWQLLGPGEQVRPVEKGRQVGYPSIHRTKGALLSDVFLEGRPWDLGMGWRRNVTPLRTFTWIVHGLLNLSSPPRSWPCPPPYPHYQISSSSFVSYLRKMPESTYLLRSRPSHHPSIHRPIQRSRYFGIQSTPLIPTPWSKAGKLSNDSSLVSSTLTPSPPLSLLTPGGTSFH